MGIGPWRPARDLERAIAQGNLEMAIAVAKDIRRERGRPISPRLALELLPLILRERPADYPRWALHWLASWLPHADSVDQAADVACALAELPGDPDAFNVLRAAAS